MLKNGVMIVIKDAKMENNEEIANTQEGPRGVAFTNNSNIAHDILSRRYGTTADLIIEALDQKDSVIQELREEVEKHENRWARLDRPLDNQLALELAGEEISALQSENTNLRLALREAGEALRRNHEISSCADILSEKGLKLRRIFEISKEALEVLAVMDDVPNEHLASRKPKGLQREEKESKT